MSSIIGSCTLVEPIQGWQLTCTCILFHRHHYLRLLQKEMRNDNANYRMLHQPLVLAPSWPQSRPYSEGSALYKSEDCDWLVHNSWSKLSCMAAGNPADLVQLNKHNDCVALLWDTKMRHGLYKCANVIGLHKYTHVFKHIHTRIDTFMHACFSTWIHYLHTRLHTCTY